MRNLSAGVREIRTIVTANAVYVIATHAPLAVGEGLGLCQFRRADEAGQISVYRQNFFWLKRAVTLPPYFISALLLKG